MNVFLARVPSVIYSNSHNNRQNNINLVANLVSESLGNVLYFIQAKTNNIEIKVVSMNSATSVFLSVAVSRPLSDKSRASFR